MDGLHHGCALVACVNLAGVGLYARGQVSSCHAVAPLEMTPILTPFPDKSVEARTRSAQWTWSSSFTLEASSV